MKFLKEPPRFLFFTGKGGVGKTSIACATAMQLAEAGQHVLLVSTDPASNVGQVFGITIGSKITPVDAVTGLLRSKLIRRQQHSTTATVSLNRYAASCQRAS